MKWADWGLTYITEFASPIIAPIYVINDMELYYGKTFSPEDVASIVLEKDINLYGVEGVVIDYDSLILNYQTLSRSTFINEYANKNVYKNLYNIEILIDKYNVNDGATYAKFIDKFFTDTGEFKAVGTLLFYQIIMSAIIAGFVTYQYPIIDRDNSVSEADLKGKFFRMPKVKFGRRRDMKLKRKKEGK